MYIYIYISLKGFAPCRRPLSDFFVADCLRASWLACLLACLLAALACLLAMLACLILACLICLPAYLLAGSLTCYALLIIGLVLVHYSI